MKTKRIWTLILLTVSFTNLVAQESKEKKEPTKEEQAWMAYMTPGKMHEMLAKSSGMWTEEITMWPAPGAPPMKSTATCMNKMIMGGRYLQGMTRGSFEGMPFEGISTTGYDNAKNVIMSTWIDNMGSGIMYLEGRYDEKNNSVELTGTSVDPITGGDMKIREVLKFVDNDNQVMDMYMTGADGKEYQSLNIKMMRKKDGRMDVPGKQPPVKMDPAKPVDKKDADKK